jgi:hypothetical protein
VDYLLPANSLPSHHFFFLMCKEMENPFLFVALIKQALSVYLLPFSGCDVSTNLRIIYKNFYGQLLDKLHSTIISADESLHLSDLTFIYNCVFSKHLTSLENLVGEGTAFINLSLFDQNNSIILSSADYVHLKLSQPIDLSKHVSVAELSMNEAFAWKGFKIGVYIHTQTALQLKPLFERIKISFEQTSIDYALESYYRAPKWDSFSSLIIDNQLATIIATIPTLLKEGFNNQNPLIQNLVIYSELSLSILANQIHEVVTNQRFGFLNSNPRIVLL